MFVKIILNILALMLLFVFTSCDSVPVRTDISYSGSSDSPDLGGDGNTGGNDDPDDRGNGHENGHGHGEDGDGHDQNHPDNGDSEDDDD